MIAKRFLAVTTSALLAAVLPSQVGGAAERERLDAEEIKMVLHTAAPEEDGFVELVVTLVDQGKLSRGLVETTLLWARRKPEHRFQYFKRGLLARLAAANRQLPSPDNPPSTSPGNLLSRVLQTGVGAAAWLLEHVGLGGIGT